MKKITCNDCGKIIEDGSKAYEDRYFFNIHCSWECLIEYMLDFFSMEDREFNTTILHGRNFSDEDLDDEGKPHNYLL